MRRRVGAGEEFWRAGLDRTEQRLPIVLVFQHREAVWEGIEIEMELCGGKRKGGREEGREGRREGRKEGRKGGREEGREAVREGGNDDGRKGGEVCERASV